MYNSAIMRIIAQLHVNEEKFVIYVALNVIRQSCLQNHNKIITQFDRIIITMIDEAWS